MFLALFPVLDVIAPIGSYFFGAERLTNFFSIYFTPLVFFEDFAW